VPNIRFFNAHLPVSQKRVFTLLSPVCVCVGLCGCFSVARVTMSCCGWQAGGVLGGPQPEAHEVEAGSLPGPGQGGQHQVPAAGGRDPGLQRSQDPHGTDRSMEGGREGWVGGWENERMDGWEGGVGQWMDEVHPCDSRHVMCILLTLFTMIVLFPSKNVEQNMCQELLHQIQSPSPQPGSVSAGLVVFLSLSKSSHSQKKHFNNSKSFNISRLNLKSADILFWNGFSPVKRVNTVFPRYLFPEGFCHLVLSPLFVQTHHIICF